MHEGTRDSLYFNLEFLQKMVIQRCSFGIARMIFDASVDCYPTCPLQHMNTKVRILGFHRVNRLSGQPVGKVSVRSRHSLIHNSEGQVVE